MDREKRGIVDGCGRPRSENAMTAKFRALGLCAGAFCVPVENVFPAVPVSPYPEKWGQSGDRLTIKKKTLREKSLKYLIFLVGVGGIEPPTN